MAHAVAHERLLARDVELDEPPAHLRAQESAQRLVERVLLVAKAAADIRLDDAHPAPRDAQRLPHDAPHDVRDLRGRGDRDAAALHLRKADVVLDVAVLHGGRIVPALDHDEPLLADGLFIVSVFDRGMAQDVVGVRLVQLRRAGLHGLHLVEYERILLVLHPDRAQRLRGGHLVFRDDGRHVVAIEAHAVGEQLAIRHILMVRVRGPRMPRGREADIRHVEARDDLHHALDPLRRGRIDAQHAAVCDGRVQHARNERAAVAQIVRILCAARHLVKGVHARNALSRAHKTPPAARPARRAMGRLPPGPTPGDG